MGVIPSLSNLSTFICYEKSFSALFYNILVMSFGQYILLGEAILLLLVLLFEFFFQQWKFDDGIQPHKILLSGLNTQLLIWKVFQKIFHCLHDIFSFKLQIWQTIFQMLLFLLQSPLGLCFSLGAQKSINWNGPPLLGWPKCAHLWVCIRVVGLLLAEPTVFGLIRLQLLDYY